MALPASGPISFNAINVELGVAGTTTASLNQASYRALAGVASGAISLSNFYGKSNAFTFSIASNQTNANLRSLAIAAGWNGTSAVTATVNGGVYVYSTSTGTPGLTINGSFPGGVSLINNGFILGMGGRGSDGNLGTTNATAGGPAISLGVSVSITNNSYIAGGGGGGSGAGAGSGGGGAGGGAAGVGYGGAAGGTGGGPGSAGGNGTYNDFGYEYNYTRFATGAGGGRILPGSGGAGAGNPENYTTSTGGGAGGGGGGEFTYVGYGDADYALGGSGGSAGASGGNGESKTFGVYSFVVYSCGGGGGWGASGGSSASGGGAGGGQAVALNGYTATFVATGIRYGSIS